jgi:hypothetical protein
MKTTDGKLKLVMRSERVERIVEFQVPLMTGYGKVGTTKKWARVYDYVYDERQKRALTEARELARRTGLVLEVTDLSRQSALGRILRQALGKISGKSRARSATTLGSKTSVDIQEECEAVISPVSQP